MLRSAIVALDTTKASATALKLAIRFCKRQEERHGNRIKLSGVAVVDRPTIVRAQAEPIGGSGFKRKRDEKLLREAHEKANNILDKFRALCEKNGIHHDTIPSEGLPHQQIEAASRSHDLIIIGKDTNFQFESGGKPGETVKHLVRDHPRPVLVFPDKEPKGNSILIAYGGSMQSAQALHMWTLMDIRRDDMDIHVVSINHRQNRADSICAEAASLLSHHDIEAKMHPIEAKKSDVFNVLMKKIKEVNPQMVVMGAFGHGGVKSKFFGTVTSKMFKACPVPLFLFK